MCELIDKSIVGMLSYVIYNRNIGMNQGCIVPGCSSRGRWCSRRGRTGHPQCANEVR